MSSNLKPILIVGGAGYIGSQVVSDLKNDGYTPIVFDNYSTGNRDIAEKLGVQCVEGDIAGSTLLDSVFTEHKPTAVMHFAACALVGESVTNPEKYYRNNVSATLNLLSVMRAHEVKRFIFSSTCATYGLPDTVPIHEEVPQAPINPYGYSKLVVEQMVRDFESAYGLQYVIFRYFNAAGARPDAQIGERHDPESHLIPLALKAAADGTGFRIFGDDYDTPDGTCIRDYIHVADISQAHILGLKRLEQEKESAIYNIGNGTGYSVREVLQMIERVTGKTVECSTVERREGDPPRLVADASKICEELGWDPKHPELEDIVKTAWEWHKSDWNM